MLPPEIFFFFQNNRQEGFNNTFRQELQPVCSDASSLTYHAAHCGVIFFCNFGDNVRVFREHHISVVFSVSFFLDFCPVCVRPNPCITNGFDCSSHLEDKYRILNSSANTQECSDQWVSTSSEMRGQQSIFKVILMKSEIFLSSFLCSFQNIQQQTQTKTLTIHQHPNCSSD